MERKQKTYQALSAINLDTYTLVNGQKRLIEFRGGTIEPRRNGTYVTSDPEVIKSMDAYLARTRDKASFKLIHEEVLLADDEETATVSSVNLQSVPGIKTVTAAKSWLLNASEEGAIKKGITSSMIKNRTDVLKIAGENGITFTDLPNE